MKAESRRDIALEVIDKWNREDSYVNLQLSKSLKGVNSRDAAFVTNIVYGVLRNLYAIDYEIDCFLHKKIKAGDSCLQSILRCGFFELSFTEAAPYAVVNEYVSLAGKKGNQGWRKLVNGVLRTRIRQGRPSYPEFKSSFEEFAFRYSMPRDLGELFREELGEETAVKTMEAFSRPAPLTLRVDGNRDELCKALINQCIKAEADTLSPYGIVLPEGGNVGALLKAYPSDITVQGRCSQLVALVLDPQSDWNVLDMCAAPGGKTTHIARLLGGKGNVFAGDIHSHKLDIIKENCTRMGLDNVHFRHKDGRLWGEEKPEAFDAVLADVPCSGLGVLASRPDSRYRKETADIRELVKIQRELVASASKTLKPGGVMVYSTCTLTRAENIDNFNYFIKEFANLKPEPFAHLLPGLKEEDRKTADCGWVQLLPHNYGGEGFFIAKFRKSDK